MGVGLNCELDVQLMGSELRQMVFPRFFMADSSHLIPYGREAAPVFRCSRFVTLTFTDLSETHSLLCSLFCSLLCSSGCQL